MPTPAPFLFGKLPAHGDFIARGLSQSARRAWDDWATDRVRQMREEDGEAFEAAHDAAPPWRFVTEAGAFVEGWSAGALAPSIDSAGRRFLVVLGVQGLTAARAAALGLSIAEALEQLIYQAIGSALDADAVVAAIKGLADDLELTSAPVADGLDARLAVAGLWWAAHDPRPVFSATPPDQILKDGAVHSSWGGVP